MQWLQLIRLEDNACLFAAINCCVVHVCFDQVLNLCHQHLKVIGRVQHITNYEIS